MAGPRRNAHCSFCGAAFAEDQAWPRACAACGNVTYRNPIPVAVLLLPVDDGLLAIRRTIEPHIGKLALPGGYVNFGESWQEGAARELLEETGITIDAREVRDFRVLSAPDSTVLIFGLAPAIARDALPAFHANEETSELVVLPGPVEMAFPLHTQVVRQYFGR
jgi:ADP-ribose pyrophosphatase YjhB (NUDIX family)